jgi:hypothetical protein
MGLDHIFSGKTVPVGHRGIQGERKSLLNIQRKGRVRQAQYVDLFGLLGVYFKDTVIQTI